MAFITPSQCRAARGLLDWSQPDLAQKSNVHIQTISAFENGTSTPTQTTLEKIGQALRLGGIELTKHNGVREITYDYKIYKGAVGFREFYDDVYNTAKMIGGDIWLYNGDSKLFQKYWGRDYLKMHIDRMMKIKNNFRFRVVVEEGDNAFVGRDYCEYKWLPKKLFNNKTILL